MQMRRLNAPGLRQRWIWAMRWIGVDEVELLSVLTKPAAKIEANFWWIRWLSKKDCHKQNKQTVCVRPSAHLGWTGLDWIDAIHFDSFQCQQLPHIFDVRSRATDCCSYLAQCTKRKTHQRKDSPS